MDTEEVIEAIKAHKEEHGEFAARRVALKIFALQCFTEGFLEGAAGPRYETVDEAWENSGVFTAIHECEEQGIL